jgi:hypothetical protein
MSDFTAEEEIIHDKQIVNDAVKILQETLIKHNRPNQLFYIFNHNTTNNENKKKR